MAGNIHHELMTLPIIIDVVTVVRAIEVFVSVGVGIRIGWARDPQFQHFLLKCPRKAGVIGDGGHYTFVGIFRTPVEISLQMASHTSYGWKVVGLHALRAGIANLVSHGIAISGRLETDSCGRIVPASRGRQLFGLRSVFHSTSKELEHCHFEH